MKPKRITSTWAAVLALVIPVLSQAQQAQRQMPVPAARGSAVESDSSQPRADTHTLSSIENLGIGSLGVVRSIISPSFTFSQSGDTGIVPGTNTSSTSLGMNLAFDRNWSRSRLLGSYSGAQVFYHPYSALNSRYHDLSVAQEFQLSRWVFRLNDRLTVSPEASFGGLDTGGTDTQSTLKSSLGVNDTILTQRAKRIANTASAEANYYLSRRSIVTVAGSFASLNFSDPGFIDTQRITGRVGYDYALNPKDSIAVLYDHGHMDFGTTSGRQQTDTIQLSYGRRITGRLALQIAAGPQLLRSNVQSSSLDWNLSSTLNYQTRRTQYSVSFDRASSTGSGVFQGSATNLAKASVHHALTRFWSVSVGGGYAFDRALAPANGTIEQFHNLYSNASVGRPVGRHVQFDVSYRFQHQGAGAGICPVLVCGSTQSRQALGVTLEWHPWSINGQ
jgi:hypothetical protein